MAPGARGPSGAAPRALLRPRVARASPRRPSASLPTWCRATPSSLSSAPDRATTSQCSEPWSPWSPRSLPAPSPAPPSFGFLREDRLGNQKLPGHLAVTAGGGPPAPRPRRASPHPLHALSVYLPASGLLERGSGPAEGEPRPVGGAASGGRGEK